MQEVQVLGSFLALQPFASLLRLVRESFSHELEVAVGELLLLLNWLGLQNGVSDCKDVCTHASLAPTLAFTPEVVRVCLAPYKCSLISHFINTADCLTDAINLVKVLAWLSCCRGVPFRDTFVTAHNDIADIPDIE